MVLPIISALNNSLNATHNVFPTLTQQRFAEDYLLANRDYFPADKIVTLKHHLVSIPEHQHITIQATPLKNPIVTLILSVLLGAFGIDRFYIGDIMLGIIKFLTSFIFIGLIWAILDIYFCYKKTKEINFQKIVHR